jgi:uncharacterized membrane protein
MEKTIPLLLALLLVLPLPALAENYMTAETRINAEDSVHSALIISLDKFTGGNITVPVFGDVKNIIYDANFEGFSCTLEEKPYGRDAVCDVSSLKRSGSFKIEFDSSKFVEKTDGGYTLKQQIATPTNLTRLTFKVILPEGTALSENSPYLPFDANNATDGRNIFVYWNRENVVAGEVFTAQVSYEKFSADQNVLIAGIFAAVALVAVAAILFRRKFSMRMALPVLRPDEKRIMEKILANKSGVNQKVIVGESGYSKAKVSKVLKSLAERGVVKLERIGRSNKIFLQSKIENKEQKPSRNVKKA